MNRRSISFLSSHSVSLITLLILVLGNTQAPAQIKTDEVFHLPRLVVYDSLDKRVGQVLSIVRGVGGGWQPIVILTVGSSGGDCLLPVAVRRNNLSAGVPSYYTSANCSGVPYVTPNVSSSVQLDFWGPQSCGYHVINGTNVLYRFAGVLIALPTILNSQLGADGICTAFAAPVTLGVTAGAPVLDLKLSFAPPFHL